MPQSGFLSVPLEGEVVKELRIEKAHTERDIYQILRDAWDAYKESNPQPWRSQNSRKRSEKSVA